MSDHDPAGPAGPAPQDAKLIALARAARARINAPAAAAVRDETGRSYVGADIALASLAISGLQLAVAQAVAAGSTALEAAAVVTTAPNEAVDTTVVADLSPGLAILVADRGGALIRTVRA